VLRLSTVQSFAITEAIKPSTNSDMVVSRGKPAISTEKVAFTIDAKDSSKRPGDQIYKFQEAINNYPQFKTNLQKIELTLRSPEQPDPYNSAKRFVTFTLECRYPEKTR
jgi:hypothetical protein